MSEQVQTARDAAVTALQAEFNKAEGADRADYFLMLYGIQHTFREVMRIAVSDATEDERTLGVVVASRHAASYIGNLVAATAALAGAKTEDEVLAFVTTAAEHRERLEDIMRSHDNEGNVRVAANDPDDTPTPAVVTAS